MSNIMSLKSIRNKPHRDGFDLSRKNAFTAKLGELLPVMVEDVMPGDHFEITADWFTRTQPVTSPAYCRFGEYYDFFFVPYHLLWRYFPQFVIQTNDNNWATSPTTASSAPTQHPYFSLNEACSNITRSYSVNDDGTLSANFKDIAGFCSSYGFFKLLTYLGYGEPEVQSKKNGITQIYGSYSTNTRGDVALNPFPLAAYQKIYNDFYRNTQWEAPSPWSYNFDYISANSSSIKIGMSNSATFFNHGLFTLRYANYNKDYFMGRMPSKQFGNEAIAAPLINPDGSLPEFTRSALYASTSAGAPADRSFGVTSSKISATSSSSSANLAETLNHAGISALAIRHAEFLQKWKEITQSGGTDYVSQIEKHFGVKPNSDMAHRCKYLGGFDKKFGIDEVVNTNLSSSSSEATLFGKGINGGHGKVTYDVKEHGIIMCIYHLSLLPEYQSSFTEKMCVKTMPQDYVIPELDNIGMQSVNGREFIGYMYPLPNDNVQKAADKVIGYVPRYAEYKTKVDAVRGAFASTLYNWVTPLNKTQGSPMQAQNVSMLSDPYFYKVRPKILDGVFSVSVDGTVDTDQFLVNCNFDVKAVRNISRDGLPY